tara:strand:+ start:1580 stop:1756 length:177 start_codon:yes stop_codon:yes gene_type:complete
MRWQIATEKEKYVVSATSSSEAVKQVRKKDDTAILYAKLMPKNAVDKVKSKWRSWFGK